MGPGDSYHVEGRDCCLGGLAHVALIQAPVCHLRVLVSGNWAVYETLCEDFLGSVCLNLGIELLGHLLVYLDS